MALQFILGNSGSGKSEYIYRKITEEASRNITKNYLVIVPEQFTMKTQKKLVELSKNKAIMNIDVLSFQRLAYRVFDELGIKNVSDMSRASLNALIRAIKRFADMDEQNKETGYKLIKVFTDMISGSFNVKINETKEVIHDTLFNKKRGSK